jgi:hypothetical protein
MTSANMMTSDMAQATSQFGVRLCPSLTLEAIHYKTGGKPVLTFQQNEASVPGCTASGKAPAVFL